MSVNLYRVSDLDDLKDILKEKIRVLKDVSSIDIVFLDDNNRHIPPSTPIQPLVDSRTARSPLVVRYPISNSSIVANLSFSSKTNKCEIPHSSGAWFILQNEVMEKFKIDLPRITPNVFNERTLDLNVHIKGRKSFGDWTFREVADEIYNNNFDQLNKIPKFRIEDLPELRPQISEKEIEKLIGQLKDKVSVFGGSLSINEATMREYISIFITAAVKHIHQYKDSTTTLYVKSELDGSRGYGNSDYKIEIQEVPVLINRIKNQDAVKSVAQSLVKVYTAAERLSRKRKREEQENSGFSPPVLFGIVTTGFEWRFIRWSGALQLPKVEITDTIYWNGIDQQAKKVVSHIARLLQAQVDILKDEKNNNVGDEARDGKRHRKK
ncbi:10818_t:CDS:2 [Acaulospora colombiana]|uniref:10818_t:CDS:1 n=1 Tax=Acaulospora colombiana TaxID=27376 RepID=A0ACA9LYA9_9GLOM|nr:10818_t:CDS:2 [Acaulospora colombiana]